MWKALATCLSTCQAKGWACSAFFHVFAIGSLAFVSIGVTEHESIRFSSADTTSITVELATFEAESEFGDSDVRIEIQPLEARIEDRLYVNAPASSQDFVDFETEHTVVRSPLSQRVSEELPEVESLVRSELPRLLKPRIPIRLNTQVKSLQIAQTTLPEFGDNRPPNYPQTAVSHGWEGTVLLRVQLSANGDVTKVEVIDSSGFAVLDGAAVKAVKTWTAKPARRNGLAVETSIRLPVKFRLPKR